MDLKRQAIASGMTLKMPLIEVPMPAESEMPQSIRRIDFSDAYEVCLNRQELSANEAYVAIFASEPAWVRWLMKLRGRIAGLFGIAHDFDSGKKLDIDHPGSAVFVAGERLGPFTVRVVAANELVVGDDDKHLNFRISTLRRERGGVAYITVSTGVEIHNQLGHAYMFLVKPFHRFIAPLMIRRAMAAGRL